jgi:hypothetical protein
MPPSGIFVADRPAGEDLKRVEVEVNRVGVAGQVDQLPDLVLAEHRKERRRVLEVGGDDAVAGDVIVVPEERPALVHRVVKDGALTGREQVLGPAVVRRGREPAVKVHDRVAGQSGCVAVRLAATQTGKALHG